MIEEIKKILKEEKQQNWKEFEIWVKMKYPFMLNTVKGYRHKFEIPDVVVRLLNKFLYEKNIKYEKTKKN